jgi:flavodoxin
MGKWRYLTMHNKTILNYLTLILISVFFTGCGAGAGGKKLVMIFIDYTKSAVTFSNGNTEQVERMIKDIASDLDYEDVVEAYPIHAATETATPIYRIRGPKLEGDLRDKQRLKDWKKDIEPKLRKIVGYKFPDESTSATNIFPITYKIQNRLKQGYNVQVYLISDLIQEYDGERFQDVFSKESKINPSQYAIDKVDSIDLKGQLKNVIVKIFVPGVPEGIPSYDSIRQPVNIFWENFFTLCGAQVSVEDL